MSQLCATAPTRRRAPRRVWRAWTGKQPWAFALGLALLLPQLQAKGAASAQQSAQGFDLWAMATGWLKSHGALGFLALGGLAFAGYALSQAQNWEALLRLLGRGPKPPEPPPTTRNETHGENSLLITGGTFRSGRDQFIGGEHEHHTHLPPPPKPELPESHTPHNLPERTTSPDRFVGRADELKTLAELLAPESSRVYLTGMGGVGKSELALQHAYDHLEHYSGGIVRLDARQGLSAMASQLVSFFRATFPAVVLPEDTSPTDLLPLCWSQWPASTNPPEPVLLLLDDQRGVAHGYEVERQLFQGLPPRFRRLITQREIAPAGAQVIDLPWLRRDSALELLALQAGERGKGRVEEEESDADELCAEVGDLPLALVLLGARLSGRPDLRLSQLLEDLLAKGAEAKALQQAHPELGAPRGVVEALLISWEPLSDAAKSLGLLLGLMAPAVIPWELVESCRLTEQKVEEGIAFGDEQEELLHAHLLERSGPELYWLHPLVRHFIRYQGQLLDNLSWWKRALRYGRRSQLVPVGRWRKQLAGAVVQICQERITQNLTNQKMEALNLFLPHIQQVAEHDAQVLSQEDLLWPYEGLARLAEYQANFADALKWCELGLNVCELELGPKDPTTASALNNVAQLLEDSHRQAEAVPLMRRALAIDEANYGPDHPELAKSLNNLAKLMHSLGRSSEAEPMMRRALSISEASCGPDHPDTATALNRLASLLYDTNRLTEAELLMRRALAISEAILGPSDCRVATNLNCLATLLYASNRQSEAETMLRRALAIEEANYGPDHHELVATLGNLAKLLQVTKRVPEAETLMRRSLAITEATYGLDHHQTATDMSNLASLLCATNRISEAEPLVRRMLKILITCSGRGIQQTSLDDRLANYRSILHSLGFSESDIRTKIITLFFRNYHPPGL